MKKNKLINFRVTGDEKLILLEKAKNLKFRTVSEYVRFVSLNTNTKIEINENVIYENLYE